MSGRKGTANQRANPTSSCTRPGPARSKSSSATARPRCQMTFQGPGVVVADDLARSEWPPAGPPERIRTRIKVQHRIVVAPKEPPQLDEAAITFHGRRPGIRPGPAGNVSEHLPPLFIDAQHLRARETTSVQVIEERMYDGRPGAGPAAHGVADPDGLVDLTPE